MTTEQQMRRRDGSPYLVLNALLCGWVGLCLFGPAGGLIAAALGAVAHIALRKMLRRRSRRSER